MSWIEKHQKRADEGLAKVRLELKILRDNTDPLDSIQQVLKSIKTREIRIPRVKGNKIKKIKPKDEFGDDMDDSYRIKQLEKCEEKIKKELD